MYKNYCRLFFWFISSLLPFAPVSGQDEVLTILHVPGTEQGYETWLNWGGGPLKMVDHLNSLSIDAIDKREVVVSNLRTAADWRRRQAMVRNYLDTMVGPWPERTPLNPQITGTLEKDGYQVEKIVFESMPGYFVTGALFIPSGHSGEGPAILKVIGHSAEAFRRDIYQNVILNLVHKGFIVFAIDPVGQGERLLYYNPETGESEVGGSTTEHSYSGVQCFISGKSLARYFAWDGIRAIDYLISRPEVDSDRIGVTGLSGGGTQSSYIGAIDQRVLAAAPMGYIVGYRRLLESIGPQDAEQVFYRGLVSGIDHADLLEVRAPKPTLHVTTTRDFFSIQGARETEQEVRKAFKALGSPKNYARVEDDFEHGFTTMNNEATFAFFQRALNLPGDPSEHNYPYLTKEELTVTETGQVSTSFEVETVFSINRRETLPLLKQIGDSRKKMADHIPRVIQEAKHLSGFQPPSDNSFTKVYRGRYQRSGYTVEKWGLGGEGDYIIPLLVFVPDGEGRFPSLIYSHPESKSADGLLGGKIEDLVKRGYLVASVDLLGFGETEFYRNRGHGPVQPFYNAQLAGRSVVGINAGDALRVLNFLKQRRDVRQNSIGAVGVGATGPAILHAAAFEEELSWLVLVETQTSYQSLVLNKFYKVIANSLVAGALTAYDLPDLIGSLAPRKCVVLRPRDHLNEPADPADVESITKFAFDAYAARGHEDSIRLASSGELLVDAVSWCSDEG
jgi:dienelactone hydrolase